MAYIYKITNDIDDKLYIGQTKYSIDKRFREHCYDAFKNKNKNVPLYSAMKEYGIDHFHIEIIEETDNPNEREMYWINQLDSFSHGYNATKGGSGRKIFNYDAIYDELKSNPYPVEISKQFGCCVDIVYDIAKHNNIDVKNKSNDKFVALSKSISCYSKNGDFVKSFPSCAEAGRWCFQNGYVKKMSSGIRGHIIESAKGKRKTAYGFVWKWN